MYFATVYKIVGFVCVLGREGRGVYNSNYICSKMVNRAEHASVGAEKFNCFVSARIDWREQANKNRSKVG